jgi:hypothetical protein
MPIFDAGSEPGTWHPSPLAAGPFAGLQGGAIAGLLIGEVEALARADGEQLSAQVSGFLDRFPLRRCARPWPRPAKAAG